MRERQFNCDADPLVPISSVHVGCNKRSALHRMFDVSVQHTGQFLRRYFGIVIRLQAQPEAARRAKEDSKAQCRISRDRTLAFQSFQPIAWWMREDQPNPGKKTI